MLFQIAFIVACLCMAYILTGFLSYEWARRRTRLYKFAYGWGLKYANAIGCLGVVCLAIMIIITFSR